MQKFEVKKSFELSANKESFEINEVLIVYAISDVKSSDFIKILQKLWKLYKITLAHRQIVAVNFFA